MIDEERIRSVRDGARLVVRMKERTGNGDTLETSALRSLDETLSWVLGEREDDETLP